MSKHTPGPWTTSRHATIWVIYEVDNGDDLLDEADDENAEANARLAAAAPELLEACQRWYASADRGDLDGVDLELLVATGGAIAKAEGKS